MLIGMLALNSLIAIITVLSVIHDMERLTTIDQIVANIHQIRASESSFVATQSREYSNNVFELLESTHKNIQAVAGTTVSSDGEMSAVIAFLNEYRAMFMRFVAENDQHRALESRVLSNGRDLAQRLAGSRGLSQGAVGGTDMTHIVGQLLDLQWNARESSPLAQKALVDRMKVVSGQLASLEEQLRGGSQDVAVRMQQFGVIRDIREYIANLEQYLKSASALYRSERELLSISTRSQRTAEKAGLDFRTAIRQKVVVSSTLMLLLCAISFVGSMFLGRHLTRKITQPISLLVSATKEIANGNLEARVTSFQDEEIAELAECFNRMADELRGNYATLEERVRERTENLTVAIAELKQAQRQLLQAGKMVALGQTIAGIAHEINTPLGVVKSSIEQINAFVPRTVPMLPGFLAGLGPDEQSDFLELFSRCCSYRKSLSTREERECKKNLLPWLSGLQGRLDETAVRRTADLLISIGITSPDPLAERVVLHQQGETAVRLIAGLTGLLQNGHAIETAVQRASKVVFALKTYGRLDITPTLQPINIIDDIEIALTLYHNLMRHGVEVIRQYGELPEINGYRDELTQIWMNLIHNSLQAMNFKGCLTIRAVEQEGRVVVSFTDTGSGIPEEVRDQIFEPFFTTKPTGEGSGLGLDIVLRIIERHGGTISFTSRPGDTTFTVTLPVHTFEGMS